MCLILSCGGWSGEWTCVVLHEMRFILWHSIPLGIIINCAEVSVPGVYEYSYWGLHWALALFASTWWATGLAYVYMNISLVEQGKSCAFICMCTLTVVVSLHTAHDQPCIIHPCPLQAKLCVAMVPSLVCGGWSTSNEKPWWDSYSSIAFPRVSVAVCVWLIGLPNACIKCSWLATCQGTRGFWGLGGNGTAGRFILTELLLLWLVTSMCAILQNLAQLLATAPPSQCVVLCKMWHSPLGYSGHNESGQVM